MTTSRRILLSSLFSILVATSLAANITIDDTSSQIVYSPANEWSHQYLDASDSEELPYLELMVNHTLSSATSAKAQAEFQFEGVAVWVVCRLSSQGANISVAVDGHTYRAFNLWIDDTVGVDQTFPVADSLSTDEQHTLVVTTMAISSDTSPLPAGQYYWGNLDAVIVGTVDVESSSSSISLSPTLFPSPTTGSPPPISSISTPQSSQNDDSTGISLASSVGAAVGTIVGISLLGFIGLLIWKRRRNRNRPGVTTFDAIGMVATRNSPKYNTAPSTLIVTPFSNSNEELLRTIQDLQREVTRLNGIPDPQTSPPRMAMVGMRENAGPGMTQARRPLPLRPRTASVDPADSRD